jgi:hypothetical protein
MGRHPTMSKRKHALVLALLASERSNTADVESACRFLVLTSESSKRPT